MYVSLDSTKIYSIYFLMHEGDDIINDSSDDSF